MNPKVSILVISYNELNYLPQAINSCFSQNYNNLEIIIGDDGSTDGSVDYISSLNNVVHSFVMQRDNEVVIPSVRVSNVIRRGLNMASGEYFAVLSGDDYYTSSASISDAVEFLENNREYFAYVSGFQRVDEAGNIIDEHFPNRQNRSMYWSGNYIHISCFVFRNIKDVDLLERMNDDTGLEYVLAGMGKWKFGKEIALAYRQREKSIQHEVDNIELSILEVMIFQDVLNYNKQIYSHATLARFYKPIVHLLNHRSELLDNKYRKYILSCEKFNNDILKQIIDGSFSRSLLFRMRIFYKMYAFRRKIFKFFK